MSDPLFSCRGPTSALLCNYAESSCNWFTMPPQHWPLSYVRCILKGIHWGIEVSNKTSAIFLRTSYNNQQDVKSNNVKSFFFFFCRWIPYLIQRKSWMWARGKVGLFLLCDVSHRKPLTPVSGLSCTRRSSVNVFSQSVCWSSSVVSLPALNLGGGLCSEVWVGRACQHQ